MKQKSDLITISKIDTTHRGSNWGVVGEHSGNVYYVGTRWGCCWKMSQPDKVAYWEKCEQEASSQIESELYEEWLQSDGFGGFNKARNG